jgi:hypothetical protein
LRFSEKRKKWITTKSFLNIIFISAGVFMVATVFKIAENFVDTGSTIEVKVLSAIIAISILTITFLVSGFINPDMMNLVFNMLGVKDEKESKPKKSQREVEEINGKKDNFTKVISVIHLVTIIIFGLSTAYYASTHTALNEIVVDLQRDIHDLTLESIRADINVFVEPLSIQNWTFVEEGVNVKVNGQITNEGSRTTLINRIEVYAIFPYPDVGMEIFTIPVNLTKDFNISKLTIGENEEHVFSIDFYIMNHLVFNNQTGYVMQIGDSMPNELGVVIWHDDGMGTIIDSGKS